MGLSQQRQAGAYREEYEAISVGDGRFMYFPVGDLEVLRGSEQVRRLRRLALEFVEQYKGFGCGSVSRES